MIEQMPITNPAPVGRDDLERLAYSFNDFGLRLLAHVATATRVPRSVAIAPVAIGSELALILKGAGSTTAAALANLLHLDGAHGVHVSTIAGALLAELQQADPTASLLIANSLWIDQNYAVAPDFVSLARDQFAAYVGAIDSTMSATACDTINDWIRARTNGKIDKIATASIVNRAALLLISAIYFKGAWATRFDRAATAPGTFTRADGSTCQTPMMHQHMRLTHRRVDDVHLVFLPFSTGRLGMVLALPPAGRPLHEFQRKLDAATWSEWMQDFAEEEGDLVLPRFKVRTELTLDRPLQEMGWQVAFTPAADFHHIGAGQLLIDGVLHNTLIEVNEEGAEGATGMAPMMRGFVHHRLKLVFDRPFLAAIVDVDTEAILFAGYVCDPTR